MKLAPADLITCNIKEKLTPPMIASYLAYKQDKIKYITGDKADSQHTLTVTSFNTLVKNVCYTINTVEQGLVVVYQYSEYDVICSHK